MAQVMLGGLLTSTLLNLVVVPVVFCSTRSFEKAHPHSLIPENETK